MMSDRFFRMLGLSVKSGSVVFGEGAVKDSLKGKTSHMVVLSTDASSNTKKKFQNSCRFYSVSYFEYGDRYTLGSATCKTFAVVLSITNANLADNLIKILSEH